MHELTLGRNDFQIGVVRIQEASRQVFKTIKNREDQYKCSGAYCNSQHTDTSDPIYSIRTFFTEEITFGDLVGEQHE